MAVKSFEGAVSELERTQVAVTLDDPIEPGANVIWCASLSAAWQALHRDVTHEPPLLAGANVLAVRLNDAEPADELVPPQALYARAGWQRDGIAETIRQELAERFDIKGPTSLLGNLIAYAHLEASVPWVWAITPSSAPGVFMAGPS